MTKVTGKRLSWDGMTALAVGLAAIVTFAVYGAAVAAFVDRTIDYIWYPYASDYGEGPILFQVAALAAGNSMYEPIAQAPYTVANYPPVFHYAVWLVWQFTGDPLVAGRLVSFLGALASGLLIFTLVQGTLHRDHAPLSRRVGGALAALFFLTHYTVIGWSATMRVDTLALAFGLLGMQIFVLSIRRPSLTWVYGLAFVLAVFTKPNMIAAALATFGVAYFLHRRRALTALAISGAAGLVALGVAAAATGGEFLLHILAYNVNEYSLDQLLMLLRRNLVWHSVDIVLLFGGLGYLLACLVERWRTEPSAESPGNPAASLMLFGSMMAASLLTVIASGKVGAWVNYFLEFEAAASLLLGTLVVRLTTFLRSDKWDLGCGRRRVMAVVALALLCSQATLGWSLKFGELGQAGIAFSRPVVNLIATAEGPVISEEMVLLYRAGRPLYFQPFIMTALASEGRWDPGPLTAAMEQGAVSFVVLSSAIGSAGYEHRFPESFRAALETRYRLRDSFGNLTVYVPR